jgi:HAD superfamily hydrolase (TIGR01509 family)
VIKAVFFDYDGVLTKDTTGTSTTCRYLSERTGIPYESLRRAFEVRGHDVRVGKLTRADTWPEICKMLGRDIALTHLTKAYESTPLNDEMFDLARSLRGRYAVGIITDNSRDRFDHLKLHQRLPELFAPIVVSAEVGCTKGDEAIFHGALAAAGVDAGNALFIDNTRSNLELAARLGMKAVYFDDASKDVSALISRLADEYGVK